LIQQANQHKKDPHFSPTASLTASAASVPATAWHDAESSVPVAATLQPDLIITNPTSSTALTPAISSLNSSPQPRRRPPPTSVIAVQASSDGDTSDEGTSDEGSPIQIYVHGKLQTSQPQLILGSSDEDEAVLGNGDAGVCGVLGLLDA
jgi:hypothetical protein